MKKITSSATINLFFRKMFSVVIFVPAFFVFVSFAAAASRPGMREAASAVAGQGEEMYQKQDWRGALEIYKGLIDSGVASWEEYYNAGNCLFRMEKYPEARLYYLKAKKLSPRADDINYNLKVVREKLGITEAPKSLSSVFTAFFTADEFRTAVTFMTWLFFIMAVIYILTHREFALWAAAAFFVIDVFVYGALYAKIKGGPALGSGIVMMEENMQSGPGGSYKVIASVPAGIKADIYDEEEGWFFVRVADSSGWIRKTALEKIE
ncbi:tetratricopeptide repeat protein [bacterium]|nr:tetratricopeptide repeat protein [bacterium]MBU4133692.1 tetratricopeptide repeat protein [bacterium]